MMPFIIILFYLAIISMTAIEKFFANITGSCKVLKIATFELCKGACKESVTIRTENMLSKCSLHRCVNRRTDILRKALYNVM